ncbi:MAG: TonB-dependent receptor, partial [Bacteroidales bacterium]|nr:TonB-dependent receptor [Bacteroidales bacterium]
NTAFNGHYVVNGLLGKEFEIAKKRKKKRSINTLSFDIKATYAGGKRYTPIDVGRTIASGVPSYVDAESFDQQFDDYFRFDLRAGFKQEFKKFSMEFSIDVQNLFDIQNMYLQRVNVQNGEITNYYQLGRLVIPQFTIRF